MFIQQFRDEGHSLGERAPRGTLTSSDFFMESLKHLLSRLLGAEEDVGPYSRETQRLEMAARSAFIDGAAEGLRSATTEPKPGGRILELRAQIAARDVAAESARIGAESLSDTSVRAQTLPRLSPERRAMQRYRDAKDAEVAREVERLRRASADAVERRVDELVQEELEEIAAERQSLRLEGAALVEERQRGNDVREDAASLVNAAERLRFEAQRIRDSSENNVRRMRADTLSDAQRVVAAVFEAREFQNDADAGREWPRPQPQPYGVSHEGAEMLGRDWLRFLGIGDAETTRASGDGGVDVASASHVAQVKNYSGSVGAEAVRQLAGVAMVEQKRAVFLTSGTYTRESVLFGARAEMALFTYDAPRGHLRPMTREAERMLTEADPEGLALEDVLAEAADMLSQLRGVPPDV
ncbi:restriction endonuclease Mrr [Cryobacterium sp. MP_3.1]|uniref:restriction endonuclease n=1 Tax=Cryobacterium sp. MP_3.1 TaxID=3071711 RepID=UPI002DFD0C87|nr:restriction endonuclease Mrr [Cryobacterium sp. MP_3.1]